MITLRNASNIEFIEELKDRKFNFIYADMIYEDFDFSWVTESLKILKENSILAVQTDYHTVAELKCFMDSLGLRFVNWLVYLNDWGGTPKNKFPQKHDDILVYSNGDNWKFYSDRIQIPKVTAGTSFDKKGTGMKTPCSVFYDHASFSTMSLERIKTADGHNIRWQKPLWLMERLLLPFTDEDDYVFDPFMGSGSMGEACIKNKRNYFGVELDEQIFKLAESRLHSLLTS